MRPTPIAILLLLGAIGCAPSAPNGSPAWREETVRVSNTRVSLTLAKPASPDPPPFLIVFASGDGGLEGTSLAILHHLADAGHWVAGFSSEEAFASVMAEPGGGNYAAARDTFASLVTQAKRALGLPDPTPIVVTGMSRGANVVIAAAGDPSLQRGMLGAVAMALTREFDQLSVPEEKQRAPGVVMDDQRRIQTYAAIERLGSIPLAIIQSTNDHYVLSAESRRLLGPDTPTRRLYEVESAGHSFDGGLDALMGDLDDALRWIAERAAP